VARECIPRVSIALAMVAVPFRPSCIIPAIPSVISRAFPIIARTTTERPRIVVISAARSDLGLASVVTAIAIVRAAASASRGASVPLAVARVVIARVKIEHDVYQRVAYIRRRGALGSWLAAGVFC
jgi:hypothetical protein